MPSRCTENNIRVNEKTISVSDNNRVKYKDKTYISCPVYIDSMGNAKLLQSDLPFACYYRLNRPICDPTEVNIGM